ARIEDFGTWRPVPADSGFRGRGLLLIRRLAEDVTVEQSREGGTTIRFCVPVSDVRDEGPRRHASETVRGRGATVEELTPGLFAALGAGSGDAVVDLRRVTYLASAGIGLLLETADRCRAT